MGVAIGGGASAVANKFLATMSPKTRALIKVGAGVILPELMPKSKVLGDAGVALAGAGAAEFAGQMMGVAGVYGLGNDPEYQVMGDGDYQVHGDDDDGVSGASNDAMGNTNDAMGDSDPY